ncbi:uncharacterized protein LOC111629067 [Centruroides sculpturatus]|uniref:uncharacterized protein LOC111629067 n=1 Tax=Centruroides sculpturatus TaxID=218467 RepID=UPI000C6D617C|nr:uncharacterized protein LOC111629067 [Centruroides sculpturatus]
MDDNCLYCLVHQTFDFSLIFGDIGLERCVCHQLTKKQKKFVSIHANFIEFMIIGHFLMLIIQYFGTEDNVIACSPIVNTGGKENAPFLIGVFGCISLSSFLIIRNGRREKLSFTLEMSGYEGEKEKIRLYQRIAHFFIAISYAFVLFLVTYISSVVIFKKVEMKSSSFRAFACSVVMQISSMYESTLWMWFVSSCILCGVILMRRFHTLSVELQRAKIQWPKKNINDLMSKHLELCEFIWHVNEHWNKYVFFLYGIALFLLSFLIYASIFGEFTLYLQIMLCFATILLVIVVTVCAFALSRIVIALYDSFQEIRRFGAASHSLADKLKVLDFMKKFQENKIGFSCGDCFILSKESPVQVYNNFYSIFNILLQIREILIGNTSSSCTPANSTNSSRNFNISNALE